MINNETNVNSYTRVAIILHWLLASLIIFQFSTGTFMVDIPKGPDSPRADWFNFHKSLGLIITLFVIFRIIWRLKNPPPIMPESISSWQKMMSTLSHSMLYVCMVGMPLTGIIGSLYSKYPIKFFGIALPKLIENDENIKTISSDLHQLIAYFFCILITIHVLAALKHLFIDCDEIFGRMMYKKE